MNAPSSPISARAFAILLGANVALAVGSVFVRMTDVGPVASAFWRMALALPVIFLFAKRFDGRTRINGKMMTVLALAGLFFAIDLAAWHASLAMTKLANATLLGNMASLLYPLYGFLIARQLPTGMQGAALGLATLGCALLMGQSYELSSRNLLGDLLALTAGIFYTFYLIAIERTRSSLPQWSVLAWSTLASALPLLAGSLLLGEKLMPGNWAPILALVFVSQIVGQGLLVISLGRLPPLIVGLTFLIQPFIAALIGWFAYGEALSPADWIGGGLVALALVLVRARG